MKKKLIFVITKAGWGGAQRYVYDLAVGLPREKFEIAVAGGGGGLLWRKLAEYKIKVISIPCLYRDIQPIKDIMSFMGLLRVFWRERPDIIHLNSTKAGALGTAAGFLYKLLNPGKEIKIVFTAHGWIFKENLPSFKKKLYLFLSRIISWLQDNVITISQIDLKEARRFVTQRKIVFIPNGASIPNFLDREQVRIKLIGQHRNPKNISDIKIIGTVAELISNKGLEYLISAAAIIKKKESSLDFKVIIIGEGKERKRLEKIIKSENMTNEIILKGFMPDAGKYLKGLDVFVLPSLKEGLPYAVLEAMQAGLPIAATGVGGIPDLLENEKEGLLVPPKNKEELSEAIIKILRNPANAQKMGDAARLKSEQKFRLYDMIRRTEDLYNSKSKNK